MKRNKVIIREHTKTLWIGIAILILDIILIIDYRINPQEFDYYTRGHLAVTIIAPIAIIFLIVKSLENKGTIEITPEYIRAIYPGKLKPGFVDLTKDVYYALYEDDNQNYILISNQKITLDKYTVLSDIDYVHQNSHTLHTESEKVLSKR